MLDQDALNYPYIRIQDVNWLKRTLLLFPHVARITPVWGGPPDDPEIAVFCSLEGRRGPLLRRARLADAYIMETQTHIQKRISDQLELGQQSFINKFGPEQCLDDGAAHNDLWHDRHQGRKFQIHPAKLLDSLADFLLRERLAWHPNYRHGDNYIEMHPRLGEAIMATLAFACAKNEGMELVTEFPAIYGRTIARSDADVFDSCLYDKHQRNLHEKETIESIIIYQRCDPSKLTPERLQALSMEWEAVSAFRAAMESLADMIPEIHNNRIRRDRLETAANAALKKWKSDQLNLSLYVRELFVAGILAEPDKMLRSVAASALVGGLTYGGTLGALSGCAIGLVYKSMSVGADLRKRGRASPTRYLTMMEREGVSFTLNR